MSDSKPRCQHSDWHKKPGADDDDRLHRESFPHKQREERGKNVGNCVVLERKCEPQQRSSRDIQRVRFGRMSASSKAHPRRRDNKRNECFTLCTNTDAAESCKCGVREQKEYGCGPRADE